MNATVEPADRPDAADRAQLKRLYSVFNSTNSLGGGAGGGIAGELTKSSMEELVARLVRETGFGRGSYFLDVGHGTGKPSLHTAVHPRCEMSAGVEYYGDKWLLSMENLRRALEAKAADELALGAVRFFHADGEDICTFNPFTHIYVYCTGMPATLMHNLAASFNASRSSQYLVLFSGKNLQRQELARTNYGFRVEHVATVGCKMHGAKTGGHVSAFVYRKAAANGEVDASTRPQSEWKSRNDSSLVVKGGLSRTRKPLVGAGGEVPVPPQGDGEISHADSYRQMEKGGEAGLLAWVQAQTQHFTDSPKPKRRRRRPQFYD